MLRIPVIPNVTYGRASLLIFYFAVLLFAALYRDSIFKNPERAGAVAASQIPWVYILATKNNAIGILLGYGYERVRCTSPMVRVLPVDKIKLSYLHRFTGRLLVLAANVHAIGFSKYLAHPSNPNLIVIRQSTNG